MLTGALIPQNLHSKNFNKHILLDLIRFSRNGISRAEIARLMDISRAAVTGIVGGLLDQGLVREVSLRTQHSGRRPILLEINPDYGYVLGIDLGASHLDVILADFSARVIQEVRADVDISIGPNQCLAQIHLQASQMLQASGIEWEDIRAAGIGVPGPVISDAGAVRMPPLMPGWDQFPIRSHFESLWGCPVSVNNDAELGALGEWAYGAAQGEDNIAYIKVGTGIGAGLLFNGRIYRGETGAAGEIGHIVIKDQGLHCACGNRGCLETIAGGRAIARQAVRAVQQGRRTKLAEYRPVEDITAREVAKAAQQGDLVAQQIISEAGTYLGVAVVSLVNLINPALIVVGGGVSQIGDLLLEPVRQAVEQKSMPAAGEHVRIISAVLGRRSSSLGAVAQALDIAIHE
jgi:glucokinase-like ROK family protein